MKRFAVWAFYGISALAILYLALYAYATFTRRALQPGDLGRLRGGDEQGGKTIAAECMTTAASD